MTVKRWILFLIENRKVPKDQIDLQHAPKVTYTKIIPILYITCFYEKSLYFSFYRIVIDTSDGKISHPMNDILKIQSDDLWYTLTCLKYYNLHLLNVFNSTISFWFSKRRRKTQKLSILDTNLVFRSVMYLANMKMLSTNEPFLNW